MPKTCGLRSILHHSPPLGENSALSSVNVYLGWWSVGWTSNLLVDLWLLCTLWKLQLIVSSNLKQVYVLTHCFFWLTDIVWMWERTVGYFICLVCTITASKFPSLIPEDKINVGNNNGLFSFRRYNVIIFWWSTCLFWNNRYIQWMKRLAVC